MRAQSAGRTRGCYQSESLLARARFCASLELIESARMESLYRSCRWNGSLGRNRHDRFTWPGVPCHTRSPRDPRHGVRMG